MTPEQLQEQEELANASVIPAEIKEQLAKKVQTALNNIGRIESAINNTIDELVMESEDPITVTEITASLLNVLRKLNQKEIMELLK